MDRLDESDMRELAIANQCTSCIHWERGPFSRSCLAFGTIPEPIWDGSVDHSVPYEGDGGTQFEDRNA